MKRAWLLAPVFGGLVYGACVGDSPSVPSGASTVPEGGAATASSGAAGNGSSGAGPTDAAADGSPSCAEPAKCNSNTLVQCGAPVQECALGCVDESGGSRCRSFDPTGAPKSTELRLPGLQDLVLNDDYVFDTDTGKVDRIGADGQRTPVRAADAPVVAGGIGYERYADRGAFYFKSFQVDAGVARNVQGSLPLAIIADTVQVRGRWFLPCGRVGGGSLSAPGNGAGEGGSHGQLDGEKTGGGGGAGHATLGGSALKSTVKVGNSVYEGAPGVPGAAYGGMPFDPLVGGSLGGPTSATVSNVGGGGAALQIIALRDIVVGGGSATVSGISVGGCGGRTPQASGGGSGGGSGGTLLLEAPTIRLERGAVLAANGGGGGAMAIPEDLSTPSDDEPAGTAAAHLAANDGALSTAAAGRVADDSSLAYVFGGVGGSATTPAATDLDAKRTAYWVAGSNRGASGPGGGGSHGFVQLFTKTGSLTFQDPTAATSPAAAPFYAVGSLVLE